MCGQADASPLAAIYSLSFFSNFIDLRPPPGISCADVGGLVDGSGAYYSTSAPCSDAAGAAYGLIAGYNPGSKVTDHNAIDLDQDAMEDQLADSAGPSWTNAKAVYTQGGFSKSYARFTLTSPITATEDAVVTGVTASGDAVSGTVKSSVTASTTLDVVYDTSEVQATYVNCQVGGLVSTAQNTCAVWARSHDLRVAAQPCPRAVRCAWLLLITRSSHD